MGCASARKRRVGERADIRGVCSLWIFCAHSGVPRLHGNPGHTRTRRGGVFGALSKHNFRSQCNLELLVSFRTSFAIRQAKRKYCTWKASVTWWQWIHAHRWVLTASIALAAVVLILHVRYKEQLARRNILRHPEDSLPHSAQDGSPHATRVTNSMHEPIMSYREAAAGTTHPTFQSGRL